MGKTGNFRTNTAIVFARNHHPEVYFAIPKGA
jgi:hypothetical protein